MYTENIYKNGATDGPSQKQKGLFNGRVLNCRDHCTKIQWSFYFMDTHWTMKVRSSLQAVIK